MRNHADYAANVAREARHWGRRLAVEGVEQHAWLDHPLILAHYRERGLIDGSAWEPWVVSRLGRPARRSLELGCGSAGRSMRLHEQGVSLSVDGFDISGDRVAEAERRRAACGAPGRFRVEDVNALTLPPDTYDLIFSAHSFHHFTALEHVMDQVRGALTPDGLFVLEEFVGPTQFQWTDVQIALVAALTSLVPERLRLLRWGTVKTHEGRPTPAEVVAVSPFESIRSGEIVPLFERYFQVVEMKRLGGTLQHLLYNGIVHNFSVDDPEACEHIGRIVGIEDALIDAGALPSDFALLVGRRPPPDVESSR
jgi:SAM-dependent methyltransferase